MNIEIKNRYTRKVIFSHDCKNNSFKFTLELGVGKNIDFSGANLHDVDLHGAYLRNINLSNANLSDTNLRGVYLRDANVNGADFSCANLKNAYLIGADLRDIKFSGAHGNSTEIRSIFICDWPIVFTKNELAIGCQQHKISEWKSFSNENIKKMDKDAFEFLLKWREFIFKAIELSFSE